MDVVSLCPMRVASVLWQPQRGGHALTFVAKATFRIQQLEARLAQEQEYPNDDDNHWNDDPARSLYSPTDLVPFKARPDVMLVGHAFAPRKEPVRSLVARIAIGDVDKAIEVQCDRVLTHDGQIREQARFLKMPLRYERAGGGPDTANPVGMRSDARPDAYGTIPLPNLQPPGQTVSSIADVFVPIGFGPIAPRWPSRWQKLNRHAARFAAGAWNDGPLPEDIDPSYFNATPEDQRPAELRDNERIVLENLHPDHPRLVTNLPGIRPCAFLELPGRAPQRVHMECDTLWIDTDRSICTLTWRGQIALESHAQQGRVVVAMEEGQKRMSWSDIQHIEAGTPAPKADEEGTAITDYATIDGSAHDAARAALMGMTSANVVVNEASMPFSAPPSSQRSIDMPRPQTAVAPHRPMTLTDVNLSAVLPFLRSELEAPEPSRPAPSGALPFAPSSSQAEPPSSNFGRASSAELSSAGFPRPTPPSEASSSFARPATPDPSSAVFPRPAAPPAPPPPPLPAPAPPPPPPPQAAPPPPPLAPSPPVPDSPWAGGAPSASAPTFGSPSSPSAPTFGSAPSPSAPTFGSAPAYDPAPLRTSGSLVTPLPPPSPPPLPAAAAVIAAATVGGALAASNAAAAAIAPPPPAVSPAPRPVRAVGPREIVDLLWFDPVISPKLREHPRYKEILADAAPKPKPVSFDDDPFEEVLAEEEPEDLKARREVFAVIARADSIDAEGVGEAMADAVSDDGTFLPPLVLLAGELSFIFDELSQLKATVAATSPFASSDKKLKETLDTVNEILQTPWIQGSTGVAEGLVQRIKEAFSQGNRTLPGSYLDSHTERMLLEQRAFQKRTVFGEPYLRTLLSPLGVQAAVPTYLPEALATKLPMVLRMRVRILAEAHLPQDQYETYPASLKAVAIGRVSPLPGRGR